MSSDTADLMLMLGRLEGKMDSIVVLQGVNAQRLEKAEARITVLERSRHYALGVVAAISTALTFGWQYVLRVFVQ